MNNICYTIVERRRTGAICVQNCQMKITTTVDGQSTTILRKGKMDVSDTIALAYEEEGAKVQITLRGREALLERFGEYDLRLPLRVGAQTTGSISFGGSAGEMPVQTLEIERIFDNADVEVRLRYRLLFGEEAQDMRLHIRAKGEKV